MYKLFQQRVIIYRSDILDFLCFLYNSNNTSVARTWCMFSTNFCESCLGSTTDWNVRCTSIIVAHNPF